MPSERPTRDGDRPPAASDPIDRPDGGWSHAHHLDARHEPVTRGGSSFAYGPNGELAKKTDAVTFAETHSYDAHGNLRTVTCPAPLAVIDYVIDGQNRRIGKKIGGSLEQGFLYGGSRSSTLPEPSSRASYASGGHALDFMMKGGATYRFVKDDLGSPCLVVDTSAGARAQRCARPTEAMIGDVLRRNPVKGYEW